MVLHDFLRARRGAFSAMRPELVALWSAFALLGCSDPGPTGSDGGCASGECCEGVVCDSPPARQCADDATLVSYEPSGRCAGGVCEYIEVRTRCAEGCASDACVGEPCAGLTCTSPPPNTCEDGALRTYAPSGTCTDGDCAYVSELVTCEDGCEAGACRGEPCAGVSCTSPPAASCVDANILRTYATPGACAAGTCTYIARETTCAFGCEAGACLGDPCSGVACAAPPASYCLTATNVRRFAAPGSCAGGSCTYAPMDETCPFGCEAGACRGDPCAALTCTTPPAAVCVGTNTARSYTTPGSCAAGSCTYTPVDTMCEYGCSAGTCVPDPCSHVTCETPPAPTCVNNTARTYASRGQCAVGACEYDHTDVDCPDGCSAGRCAAPTCGATTCDAPPAPSCVSASRARTYAPLGRCVSNACSYQPIDVDCSLGCLNGACLPGSWTTELQPGLPSRTIVSVEMALDALDQVHIAACDASGNVIYRHRDAYGWSETIVDPMLGYGCRVALALDSAGRPMIAYYEPTNRDLRFAQPGPGGTFAVSLVANSGDVGDAPSITVDAMDRPMISFADRATPGIRVATRVSGSWTFETAIAGSSAAGATASSIAMGVDGRLHVLAGLATSVATPSGGYDQPPLYYAVRSGSWTVTTVSPDGLILKRGLRITPLGEARVLYGVVRPVGQNDELRYQSPGRDEIARHVGNFLDGVPVGMFGPSTEPRFVWRNTPRYVQRREGGFWEDVSVPLSWFSIVDLRTGNDARARFLQPGWSVVTEPACVPACTGRSCGGDGCGGSCGTCAAGLSCDPSGACGTWSTQTVDLGVGANVDSSIATAVSSSGRVHAAFHHGSAGATIDGVPTAELFYVTNASGTWSPSQSILTSAEVDERGIALSDAGLPLIARYTTWNIAVLSGDGAGTFTPTSVPGSPTQTAPFIVDDAGDWHLMVAGGGTVTYARRTGTTWSTEIAASPGSVDPRGSGYAEQLSFAIDGSGRAHAIWIQTLTYTGQVSLQYSTNAGGSWTTTARVAPYTKVYGASRPQIVVDGAGIVHAIYFVSGTGGGLVHATRSGNTWTTETIPNGSADYRAVADSGGLVVLTWSPGVTMHRRGATGWTQEPIAVHGGIANADIGFDAVGRSHIVFWERGGSTPPLLRYATHP